MQQKRMKITLAVGIVYVLAAMCIMLYAIMSRAGRTSGMRQEQVYSEIKGEYGRQENGLWKILSLSQNTEQDSDIIIPTGQRIKAANLKIENKYYDNELLIGIAGLEGMEEEQFVQNTIAGNLAKVKEAVYETEDDTLWLKFKLDGIYEYRSSITDTDLCIELVKPKEVFDRVIVMDSVYSENVRNSYKKESKEQEILSDIAKLTEQKVNDMDATKIYYAETGEKVLSLEEKLRIIEETEADFYIGIALNYSEDKSIYGIETIYNRTYFIPYFGNTELADCLERNVTLAVSGRAKGLTQAKEEDIILQKAKVPAVIVKVGYLSNEKEAALLNKSEYRERIAEGVLQAVQESYEKMENEKR